MAEAEQLLAVQMNLLNSASGKPIMGLVYDTLSGAYIMTYPENEVERINIEIAKSTLRADSMTAKIANLNRTSPDRYSQVREEIEALTSENMILQQDIDDMKSRLIELSNRINVDPIVFNQCIDKIAGSPQLATLPNRLSKYGINPHGGRALISACFPDDFDYNIKNVVIKEGVLISGVLTKETLGTADNSIISEMTKQLGSMDTVDFMSDIQFVVSTFMQQHGLSVGAIDCMPNDPMFKSQLDEILATASLKVISYSGKPSNQIIAEARERKIQEALDVAKSEGDKIVQKYFKPDNAILIMANSGAKGTVFNAIQMSSMLAQQKVSGKRIQPVLPGERTLPSTQPGTRDPKDFGFCVNSFTSGLEPSEFFYHAAGGREGITDTAIGASSTGYLQHQLIKSAEDIHISTDGSVRSADNTLIQFVYGEDGFDAAELTKVKIHNEVTPMFRNIEMLADKINRKYATQ